MDTNTHSLDEALTPLAALERRMEQAPVLFRRHGFLHGLISVGTPGGEILAQARPGAVLKTFHHRTTWRLGPGTELTLATGGILRQWMRLSAGDRLLLALRMRPFARRYRLQDGQGHMWHARRTGAVWRREFTITSETGTEAARVVSFAARPLVYTVKATLSRSPGQAPDGLSAGLALLLYYHRYLVTRSVLLASGGGGIAIDVPCAACCTHGSMLVWLAVGVGVRVCVRTGRMGKRSAARFAVVPATGLTQHNAAPKVACELAKLLRQGHRLLHVGQEGPGRVAGWHGRLHPLL